MPSCSCDGGNLELVLVRSSGRLLPRVGLFARRDVAQGEELTISYGSPTSTPGPGRCLCGTPACLGYLPSQQV